MKPLCANVSPTVKFVFALKATLPDDALVQHIDMIDVLLDIWMDVKL